jgi:hypothetical protein
MKDHKTIEEGVIARDCQGDLAPSFAVDGRRVQELVELEDSISGSMMSVENRRKGGRRMLQHEPGISGEKVDSEERFESESCVKQGKSDGGLQEAKLDRRRGGLCYLEEGTYLTRFPYVLFGDLRLFIFFVTSSATHTSMAS